MNRERQLICHGNGVRLAEVVVLKAGIERNLGTHGRYGQLVSDDGVRTVWVLDGGLQIRLAGKLRSTLKCVSRSNINGLHTLLTSTCRA